MAVMISARKKKRGYALLILIARIYSRHHVLLLIPVDAVTVSRLENSYVSR